MMIHNLWKNKVLKNASWLIGGRMIQMILSFIVGLLTARYLGPSNYGRINYAATYSTFFASLCTLGINSVIVKHFVDFPDEEGTTLYTAIGLRLMSSILSLICILGISAVVDKAEPLTRWVVFLSSISLVFQSFDMFNYWFQAHLQSKYSAIASLIAYLGVSLYKIILLIQHKSILWFAVALSLDYVVIAFILGLAYMKVRGPKFHFSWCKAKMLLSDSYHFILSALMVSIYGGTDKFMLKHMGNEVDVGYYSTAVTLCNIWVFVLAAIIDSLNPIIMRLHTENKVAYKRKNKQLYAIVFYVSMGVSGLFVLLGDIIVPLLYGEAYKAAVGPLKILTWYVAFSYLGVARNAWVVCEKKQKYLKYLYAGAAVTNVILNYILIPTMGVNGASLASLVTQIAVTVIFPIFFKDLRENVKLMISAICLKF